MPKWPRDLIQRHFGPCDEMDRRYVGDITYISTWEGWAYLATVIDLASRRVVGWALADHMRTELVERRPHHGVRTPCDQRRASFFIRTAGRQYTSGDFAELARDNGVVLSVGRKGECWDNAVAESFFATIKRELIDTRAWPTRTGLRRCVFEYIEGWYNTRRLHSTLGYLSPAQYEAVHHNADRFPGARTQRKASGWLGRPMRSWEQPYQWAGTGRQRLSSSESSRSQSARFGAADGNLLNTANPPFRLNGH